MPTPRYPMHDHGLCYGYAGTNSTARLRPSGRPRKRKLRVDSTMTYVAHLFCILQLQMWQVQKELVARFVRVLLLF